MIGYLPANPLDPDRFITAVRVERASDGTLTVQGIGEQRTGLTRELTQKTVDATDDTTGYKRTWETIWDAMNASLAFQSLAYNAYAGLLGSGEPFEDTPDP